MNDNINGRECQEVAAQNPVYSIAVPTNVLTAPNISQSAKLLYGVIDSFQRNSGVCYATNATLGETMGEPSERTISRCVSELRKAGYIVVTNEPLPGKKKTCRKIFIATSMQCGHRVDKNGDTPRQNCRGGVDKNGDKVNKESNNKKKIVEQSLTDEQMGQLFVEWIKSVAQPDWSRQTKNNLFECLCDFYNPSRKIKKGGKPPQRTELGFKGVRRNLEILSNGNPLVMQEILNSSIGNGWSGIHPLKDEPKSQNVPVRQEDEGRYIDL